MTFKRDKKKDETKASRRPALKKETVKDLEPRDKGEDVKGGAAFRSCGCTL